MEEKRIKGWLWRRRSNPTAAEPSEQEQVKTNVSDEQVRLNVLSISGTADSLVDNIHMHISEWGNQYYHFGQHHGHVGTRDFQMETTAEIHASLVTDRMVSTVTGRIEALEVTIPRYKAELKDKSDYLDWCRKELQEQTELKMNDSRQFNLFNAWFSFGVAILIILADIAISLNLVSFFGIGNLDADASFWDKLKDPELLLFSLGIAFCTIYIKIFYDEYIAGKFGYHQHHFRQMVKDEAKLHWLRAEFWTKFAVKFIFLIGLLTTLYYMARYRTYFTVYGETEGGAIQQVIDTGKMTDMHEVILYSFIGITMLLPVISGVALSVWLKVLSNRRILKDAANNCEKAEVLYTESKEQFVQQVFIFEQLKKYFEEWDKRKEKVKLLTAYFNQQYKQGFKIGYHKIHGSDLYQLAELARNEELNNLFAHSKNGSFNEN
jgi:hypothetical protein